METKRIDVQIPLGVLRATPEEDKLHPGIWVELQVGEELRPVALVEYVNDEADYKDGMELLITRVWKDLRVDEHTDRVVHDDIKTKTA